MRYHLCIHNNTLLQPLLWMSTARITLPFDRLTCGRVTDAGLGNAICGGISNAALALRRCRDLGTSMGGGGGASWGASDR
eukprot:CAMPEP_0172778274 /NCGR_PEP_ID=MMETSP1074-20121228/201824_1 /TAXON_ID=2916 /ORGANISM="Ceratium fusus, Strain PA161109" /LENGTH=79 /DNA_ID=CAMNT_0013615205 /DNA_START=345 /DNA_END=585 /DNA_ORIENTATION=+